MSDNGTLSFATAIDTSGYDEGMQYIEQRTSKAADSIGVESEKIKELLTFPTANIDINIVNAQNIDQVAESIQHVISLNEKGVKELQTEYDKLAKKMGEAYSAGNDKEYFRLKQQADAIKSTISARNKAISEARKMNNELDSVAAKIAKETSEQEKQTKAQEAAANSTQSLKSRLRDLKMELVELEAAGQRNTERYKEVQTEVAKLTDAWGDAQAQANILANDQRGMQGIISGLSGLSGAASAATGVMALFGSQNEELNKIMLRVQSLMSITIGLQQVQQTLNKDSAFSLVTLNGLKEWWNKITIEATSVQTAEAAATTAETSAQEANAVATAANVAATEAQVVADTQEAAASIAAAGAEGVQTAAIGAETTAAVAGTAANWSLAAAFRAVGAAIMSIPVIGWIAAGISALIAVVSMFTDTEEENTEAIEKNKEAIKEQTEEYSVQERVMNKAAEISAKEKTRVELLNRIVHDNTAALADRRKALAELNKIIPKYNGFLSKEGEITRENTKAIDDYIAALDRQALAKALENELVNLNQKEVENKIRQRRANRHITENQNYADPQRDYQELYRASTTEEFNQIRERQTQQLGENLRRALEGESVATKEALDAAKQDLKDAQKEAQEIAADKAELMQMIKDENLQGDVASNTGNGRSGSKTDTYDPKKAALDRQNATNEWAEQVKKFIKDAQMEVSDYTIEAMADGQEKEIAEVTANAQKLGVAWETSIDQLAANLKAAKKEMYMSQKGATEVGWANSEDGKKSVEEYRKQMMQDYPQIAEQYEAVRNQILQKGERERQAIRDKYTASLIESYGTTEQKIELLQRQWTEKMKQIPTEYLPAAQKQMSEAIASLQSEDFKKLINFDDVFGSLDNQSLDSLQVTLGKVREYFNSNKDSMSTDEIKEYTEAIKSMEEEIASRNPFVAFHKSLQDLSAAKQELVVALQELATAQGELTIAQQEYNAALTEHNELQTLVDTGEMEATDNRMIDSETRLTAAKQALTKATQNNNSAEQKTLTARNNITKGYKDFANSLRSVGSQVTGVGKDAKNLAACFSSDVAKGMGKALDLLDTMLDATINVVGSLADTSKSVGSAITGTAEAAGDATKSTATATATAISTVEKASIILTVISAALQIAMAIANLFNNDDELQEDIDNLQNEIDHLQWQLDNLEAVKLEETLGATFENVSKMIKEVKADVIAMYGGFREITSFYDVIYNRWLENTHAAEVYEKQIEKIADAYANVAYTANHFLGSAKWDNSRAQLENYSEQLIKIRQQYQAEEDKKDTDDGKLQEYKEKMTEIANEMSTLLNDMVEGIIGGTAADIASQLGDAFFEACQNGEDAMEAWSGKAKDIIRDVLKQMLVSKFLEEPLGQIFDKYKSKWFGTDGTFAGIDAVIDSMSTFSNDLNSVGESFSEIWSNLPSSITDYFSSDADREGTQKGIATASQESVDENNARLTTIQGHTFTIVQGLSELNTTSASMLQRLTGIESNTGDTNDKLDSMQAQIRQMRDGIDDLNTKGIKLKS